MPLAIKPLAPRRNGLDLDLELAGDVARAVGSGAEFSHRTQVLLLGRGEPIEAHEEEVLVEVVQHAGADVVDLVGRDRVGVGGVPHVVAPLLQEVRVAVVRLDDDNAVVCLVRLTLDRLAN